MYSRSPHRIIIGVVYPSARKQEIINVSLSDLDKIERLVLSTMGRPHDNSSAFLHRAFFDVEDETVQLRSDCASLESEPLVVSAVCVVVTDQSDACVLIASGYVDNQAGLRVEKTVFVESPQFVVVCFAFAKDNLII